MRVSLLAAFLFCIPVQAQTIPLDAEIAELLLGIESAEDVSEGTIPDVLLPYLPEGATVIGSIRGERSQARGLGSARGLAFAWVDASPEAAAKAFSARTYDGRRFREPYREPNPKGGFVNSVRPETYFTLDSEDNSRTVVSVSFMERSRGGSYVLMNERALAPFENVPPREWPGDALIASLPLLTAPEGAQQQNAGSGGGEDYRVEKATLTSDLSVAAVAAHYAALMEAGGWAPFGETASNAHAASGWTKDVNGQRFSALFQIARADGGEDLLSILVNNGEEE